MIKAKNYQDRINDICGRTNLSYDIVKRVLDADADSILDDLKKGYRVVKRGVCSFTPSTYAGFKGNNVGKLVSVKCDVSPRITNELNSIEDYGVEVEDLSSEIVTLSLEAFL